MNISVDGEYRSSAVSLRRWPVDRGVEISGHGCKVGRSEYDLHPVGIATVVDEVMAEMCGKTRIKNGMA